MDRGIFRMYDVRGIADKDLTDENVYLIGRAFASYIKRNGGKKVAAGMDVRLSSPRIKNAFTNGVLDSGLDVADIGICTTPMLYYAQFLLEADGGIMVTGSHNPIEYNGLKMVDPDVTIFGDVIQDFYKAIESNDFEEGKGIRTEHNIEKEYIDMCVSKIELPKKLRIMVDPGNGTAGPIAKEIFVKLGIDADFINFDRDGTFPNHLPDPTVMEFITGLREKTKQGDYDMGIGYDGDCDRIGLLDENGDVIFGDQILGILAHDLLSRKPGEKIVFDVKCSQGLEEMINRMGGKPIMYKTGHSVLKRKMKEENALLAGEMSGHMFFKENYYGFDDGLFASLLVMQIVSKTGKKLSELKMDMPYYKSTPEIRVDCTDEDKFDVVEQVTNHYREKGNKLIDIDGARVYFDGGWALVRASNTQPILVVRVEAKTEEAMESIKSEIREHLSTYDTVNTEAIQ